MFVLGEDADSTLGLNNSICDVNDIPWCSTCNSEKECSDCYYGEVLVGDGNEFYGRC